MDREFPDPRWCGAAPVLAKDVMGDWMHLIGACPPWCEMPLDDVTGEFRAVLEELLQPRESAPERRADRLRSVARAHGAFRRRQGCRAFVLREEAAVAEEAIAVALQRSGIAPAAVTVFQDSLIAVLGSIERAAYGGFVDCAEPPHYDA